MTDVYLDTASRDLLTIDIHPICDVWELAYHHFGAVSFLPDFMNTDDMIAQIIASAAARNIHITIDNARGQEFNIYGGDIKVNGVGYYGRQAMDIHCQGCLFWTRHYAGSFLAKRLHLDGFLYLHGAHRPDEKVIGMHDFLNLVRDEMRKPHADYIVTSITHGAIWHTVALKYGPDLEYYPMDDAWDWCGSLLTGQDEFKEWWGFPDGDTFIGQECRHGIGHGVFYATALWARGLTSADYDACIQYRPYSWTLPDYALDRANAICDTANDFMIRQDCRDGVSHSYELMTKFDWSNGVY